MKEATTRGIDHIGVTVADIDAATEFLVEGLGGQVIYESLSAAQPAREGQEIESRHNLAPETRVVAQRMIATGPDIELFEMHAPDQAPSARGSDLGMTHLAFYVDDMAAAVERFRAAGGDVLSEPAPPGFRHEAGEGNLYCYGLTPWGMSIE